MTATQAAAGKKSEIDRSKITPMLLKMFELWNLATEEANGTLLALLKLFTKTKRKCQLRSKEIIDFFINLFIRKIRIELY